MELVSPPGPAGLLELDGNGTVGSVESLAVPPAGSKDGWAPRLPFGLKLPKGVCVSSLPPLRGVPAATSWTRRNGDTTFTFANTPGGILLATRVPMLMDYRCVAAVVSPGRGYSVRA